MRSVIAVLIGLVSLLFSSASPADTLRMRDAATGHWYQRFDTTMTWHAAEGFCRSQGGYLATITSQEENAFVYPVLAEPSPQWCWLGGTDEVSEGDWRWANGEPWMYKNWAGGEPNNCAGSEHYLMYFTPGDGRAGSWNDLGTGLNSQGTPGGCGCGICESEWYPLSAICEWDRTPLPPRGLISWWPASGTADDVVDGNPGTLVGSAGYGTGIFGQAFSLSGTDSFVMVPDSTSLNFGDRPFSVALWVNFRTLDGEQVMIEKYVETLTLPSYGWTLSKPADNTVSFSGGPKWPYDKPNSFGAMPPSMMIDTWYFVTVTWDGCIATIYWNGMPIGSQAIAFNPDSSSSLKFGHRGSPSDTPGSNDTRGFYLNGLIDEVMIFDRALTAKEVRAMHEAGAAHQTVAIDVKPGSFPNAVNPSSRGRIAAAILTTEEFDAATVDPLTVRFGKTGTEAAPVQYALEDVDEDGDQDLVLHFWTRRTGIDCGDTLARLTGRTRTGVLISGSDSIMTVGCR